MALTSHWSFDCSDFSLMCAKNSPDSHLAHHWGTAVIITILASESHSVVSDSLRPHHGLHSPGNSPGQNTGVGSLSLFQGIFPTQGLNPGLPHCRWIVYQLSHKGSTSVLLEATKYPFYMWGSSLRPRPPWWLRGKESAFRCRRCGFNPWVGKIP